MGYSHQKGSVMKATLRIPRIHHLLSLVSVLLLHLAEEGLAVADMLAGDEVGETLENAVTRKEMNGVRRWDVCLSGPTMTHHCLLPLCTSIAWTGSLWARYVRNLMACAPRSTVSSILCRRMRSARSLGTSWLPMECDSMQRR